MQLNKTPNDLSEMPMAFREDIWDKLTEFYPRAWERGEPAEAAYYKDDSPMAFALMPFGQQRAVLNWLAGMRKTLCYNHDISSYGIKHVFERTANGFYMTNGQFKGAMIAAGFKFRYSDQKNWLFNISNADLQNADPTSLKNQEKALG